jgi:hypothetical protein
MKRVADMYYFALMARELCKNGKTHLQWLHLSSFLHELASFTLHPRSENLEAKEQETGQNFPLREFLILSCESLGRTFLLNFLFDFFDFRQSGIITAVDLTDSPKKSPNYGLPQVVRIINVLICFKMRNIFSGVKCTLLLSLYCYQVT